MSSWGTKRRRRSLPASRAIAPIAHEGALSLEDLPCCSVREIAEGQETLVGPDKGAVRLLGIAW